MEDTTFGKMLRNFRTEGKFTQMDLQESSGINNAYICRLEANQHPPQSATVIALARAMRLSQEDEDRLMLAAGHVPEDVRRAIMANPEGMLARVRQ